MNYSLVLAFCGFIIYCVAGVWACPDYWITYSGNCYLFVDNKVNWFHAAKNCSNSNGWLVDITSADEDQFLKDSIKRLHAHDDPEQIGYWTSGNDIEVEGQYMWGYPSETKMTYTDWFPGEPNNVWYDGRAEDCIALWGHDNHAYRWNDQPCDILDFYVCKMEDNSGGEVIG